MIPVVFSVDHKYIMPLSVALVSMLETKNSLTNYEIFILLSDDVSQMDVRKLNEIFLKYKIDHNVHYVSMNDLYSQAYIPSNNSSISKATYYRLNIANILPIEIGKCIYCDCDVVINCDLSEFYNIDIQDYDVAGVYDEGCKYFNTGKEYHNDSTYINAGILLINLETWRSSELTKRMQLRLSEKFLFMDQDIINIECSGRKKVLPSTEYIINQPIQIENGEIERIIHFAGLFKPWEMSVDNLYFKLWNKYALKAGYGDLVNKNIKDYEIISEKIADRLKKKVILWGARASIIYIKCFLKLFDVEVVAVGDNDLNKIGLFYDDILVLGIDDIRKYKDVRFLVTANKKYYKDIKMQLISNNVKEEDILHIEEVLKV